MAPIPFSPRNDWQTAMASRMCSSVSHLRSSTSSRPTWPPKPRHPRRRKYRTNSLIRRLGVVVFILFPHDTRCREHRFADAERERQRLLKQADEWQHDQEMQEIVGGAYSAQEQPGPRWRLSASIGE